MHEQSKMREEGKLGVRLSARGVAEQKAVMKCWLRESESTTKAMVSHCGCSDMRHSQTDALGKSPWQ